MTTIVPMPSASGTLRAGSRISSATYDAAFQPAYANITGTNASSHELGVTAPADDWRLADDPVPNDNPSTMNSTNAVTLSAARTSPTMRPGPTPRTWIPPSNAVTALA